ARTIQVVRKRRVLTKSPFENKVGEQPADAESVENLRKIEPVVDAEELALREAEARKQAELIARQAAEIQRKKLKKVEAENIEKNKSVAPVEEKGIRKEKADAGATTTAEVLARQIEDDQVSMVVQKEGDKAL